MKTILIILAVIIAIPLLFVLITIIGGAIDGLYRGLRDCFFKKRISIKPKEVEIPEKFAALIPLADKIGIGDDLEREKIESQLSPQEKEEIRSILPGKIDELESWIDSISMNGYLPENAIPLSRLLEAVSEMGLWPRKNT